MDSRIAQRDLDRIFNARSIAVAGASPDSNKIGDMVLDSIIRGGYEGQIYPINPKANSIHGLRAYPSVSDLPGDLDLAVIVVPSTAVPRVLRQAAEKGAAGAIILSAGFRESGRPDLEDEILSISRQYGLSLVGPNIQGVTYLPNRLCAMMWPVLTTPGPLTIIGQSGTVSAALAEWATEDGVGISGVVNLGNQVDLCETDFLEFFAEDSHTGAIALYLEGVKDGRRFLEALRRVTRRKPVAILKAGQTPGGGRAAASHTGSLAGSYSVFVAACRQVGAVCAQDLDSLHDMAKALATMREPRGNRLLMMSSSGGAGVLAVQEAEKLGLVVTPPSPEFVERLKGIGLPFNASLSNPLDLASFDVESFRRAITLAAELDVADIILASFGDPVPGSVEMVTDLAGAIRQSLVVCYFGGGGVERRERPAIQAAGISAYPAPERAVRGIAAAVWAAEFRRSHSRESRPPVLATPTETRERARPGAESRSGEAHLAMLETEAVELLSGYGVPYPAHGLARAVDEAVGIADGLGYPVVLKVVSPDVLHKSDAGGVVVGLQTADDVRRGFGNTLDRVRAEVPEARIEGVLVCRQAANGVEAIVGAIHDATFGPTVMFGLGGIFAEVLKDVSFRVAPLDRRDAEEMVCEIRGYALLTGARGQDPCDFDALVDLIMSVSRLVADRPDIVELDLNPVRLWPKGLMALDARMIVKG